MKGKKIVFIFLFPIALGALLSSCEDCYKCGFDQEEPYFNVKFLNARHLLSINDSISLLDDQGKETSAILLESNRFLNSTLDSLDIEEDSLAIISLEFKIDSVESKIDTLNKSIANFNAVKTRLNQVKRKITAGAVPLESIASSQGRKITFVPEDSLAAYRFPLAMNDVFAHYFINIKDSTYTLEVAYATEQIVENGSVVIKANNLTLLSTSNIDSAEIHYRNDLRKTNETYLYLYF